MNLNPEIQLVRSYWILSKNHYQHHNHNIFMILSPSISTSSLSSLQSAPKKFLSKFLDLALMMGACLNPPCNPARVSSQLENEVLSPAFQKVIIFGIPWRIIISFRSPESLLFLYFLSCEAAFFLLVACSRYRLGEHSDNDNGNLYTMLISLYITKIPHFC